jgi:hypothetical protein
MLFIECSQTHEISIKFNSCLKAFQDGVFSSCCFDFNLNRNNCHTGAQHAAQPSSCYETACNPCGGYETAARSPKTLVHRVLEKAIRKEILSHLLPLL